MQSSHFTMFHGMLQIFCKNLYKQRVKRSYSCISVFPERNKTLLRSATDFRELTSEQLLKKASVSPLETQLTPSNRGGEKENEWDREKQRMDCYKQTYFNSLNWKSQKRLVPPTLTLYHPKDTHQENTQCRWSDIDLRTQWYVTDSDLLELKLFLFLKIYIFLIRAVKTCKQNHIKPAQGRLNYCSKETLKNNPLLQSTHTARHWKTNLAISEQNSDFNIF